jgi:hypothetical protein
MYLLKSEKRELESVKELAKGLVKDSSLWENYFIQQAEDDIYIGACLRIIETTKSERARRSANNTYRAYTKIKTLRNKLLALAAN